MVNGETNTWSEFLFVINYFPVGADDDDAAELVIVDDEYCISS